MLIVDSVVAPRLVRGAKEESKAETIQNWVKEQTANVVYIREHDLSLANADRQMGQKFWPSELEARLKKLNPNLLFEVNSFNPTKKALYHVRRGEGKHFICAYENLVMPEHSIMKVKEEVIQDLNYIRQGADGIPRMHLDRKDLSTEQVKYATAIHRGADGELVEPEKDPNAIPIGFKKVLVPWGEYVRGWRTVTIKLVEAKVATPTQIESIFGADDRASWAKHMGKQDIRLPW